MQDGGLLYYCYYVFMILFYHQSSKFFNLSAKRVVLFVVGVVCYSFPAYSSSARMHFVSCFYIYIYICVCVCMYVYIYIIYLLFLF